MVPFLRVTKFTRSRSQCEPLSKYPGSSHWKTRIFGVGRNLYYFLYPLHPISGSSILVSYHFQVNLAKITLKTESSQKRDPFAWNLQTLPQKCPKSASQNEAQFWQVLMPGTYAQQNCSLIMKKFCSWKINTQKKAQIFLPSRRHTDSILQNHFNRSSLGSPVLL